MNKVRVVQILAVCAALPAFLLGCGKPTSTTIVAAPPGPADLGPATGLSTPPANAIVFDLKYHPQTGVADDIPYHSYWGYGGSEEETKTNSFLQEVRKKTSHLHYVNNFTFTDRKWAALEYQGQQASALYFDLNADGRLQDNERIPPTLKTEQGFEFITPDFMHAPDNGSPTLCRVLLQANFYKGSSQPNCMWSSAALMEGTASIEGRPARLLLYTSSPGGPFDKYGSSSYSLLMDGQTRIATGQYVPREMMSSLIASEGLFYHLTVEGRRSNGLPARVLLVKDTSPTGELAAKLVCSNSVQTRLTSLYLHGVEDKTVFLRCDSSKPKVALPVGTYALDNGQLAYGAGNAQDWEVSFTQGPRATIKAGEVSEVALGQPTLKVRAIEERDRWNSQAKESATFKPGTRIYIEPRITGQGQEVFSRFRQATVAQGQKTDRPPKLTITGPDGKQVLSKTMEYG